LIIAAVSAARPKIADYPFTKLHPKLGVVRPDATTEFVLADIPGLIEGASEGAGLGDRFLGHIERCAVLLHLVDGTQADPAGAYRTVRAELEGYGGGLVDKPEIVALNKTDAMTPQARASRLKALSRAAGKPVLVISGATGEGVPEAVRMLAETIAEARRR
jgi:GTP-binding protein